MDVSDELHDPAALTPGKGLIFSLRVWLSGRQTWFENCE